MGSEIVFSKPVESSEFTNPAKANVYAASASHAHTSSFASTASYAQTSSFAQSGTGSYTASFTSSFRGKATGSFTGTFAGDGISVLNVVSGSFASRSTTASNADTASLAYVAPLTITFFGSQASPQLTLTSGAVEPYSSLRTKVDLTGYRTVRLVANIVAVSNAVSAALAIQYSLDEVTWQYIDGATGAGMQFNTVGVKAGSFVPITGSAKTDVTLRMLALASGSTKPTHGLIVFEAR